VNTPGPPGPILDLSFPCSWRVEILPARPLILPPRSYVYPVQADEVERGALELLISSSANSQPFLATCALGFRDPAVPTGIWSCPNADELCAVSGGYAYIIDTAAPARFTMLPLRPALQILTAPQQQLMLFVGHHSILAWGQNGLAWQSAKLSDEGLTIHGIDGATLHGRGWEMMSDKETPFSLDLRSGREITA
jgi:hypothetical protein